MPNKIKKYHKRDTHLHTVLYIASAAQIHQRKPLEREQQKSPVASSINESLWNASKPHIDGSEGRICRMERSVLHEPKERSIRFYVDIGRTSALYFPEYGFHQLINISAWHHAVELEIA